MQKSQTDTSVYIAFFMQVMCTMYVLIILEYLFALFTKSALTCMVGLILSANMY